MTPFYSVAVVFSKDRKKILLGKRREDKLWTSPAGGGEDGESPKACIIRELFEEANISCKENDLKFLTSMTAKNGKPIFIFTMCMDSKQNIHVKNDPDKEVPSWNWYSLDAMPKLEENRQKTVNMAKMKMKDLIKSIVSTDMHSGVDLHTEDFSQDDMAARDSDWYNKITALMYDAEVNEPEVINLENGFEMTIQRIHEGLYSGSIKDENQDRVLNFAELSIPSLVQTLKAKEFIDKDSKIEEMAQPVETPPEGDSDVEVKAPGIESLKELMDTLKNVHIEGDLNITLQKSIKRLMEKIQKSGPKRGKRGFPIGTQRTWSNGVKAVKHADGWVVLGGKHHGKLVGKFKEEAQDHHLEVANEHHTENADKEVQDIQAQIKQLKEAHEKKQAEIKAEHDKLIADLKAKHEAASKKGDKLEEKGKRTAEKPKDSEEGKGSDEEKEETGTERTGKESKPSGKEDKSKDSGSDTEPTGSVSDSSGEDEESDVDSEAEGSPREEAQGFLESKGEYENARDSKVTNLGEDLLDSARHKRAWSTAAEAEATGEARKVVKRAKMIKENPMQLAGASHEPKAAFLYQVMHGFPVEPDYKMLESSEYQKLANNPEEASPQNRRRFGHMEFTAKNEVDARKEYIEAYDKIKKKAEEINRDSSISFTEAREKMYEFVQEYRRELNGTEGTGYSQKNTKYSLIGSQLHNFQTKTIGSSARRSKAMTKTAEVLESAMENMTGDEIMNSLMSGSQKGKPLSSIFGVKSGKSKKTYEIKGPAQFYVTDKAKRKGPETSLSNMKEAQKSLTPDGEFQMRGIQYGNSVTDEERVHHTTRLAESLQDLTDILGIPKEMASFNGRLGMAIGARGKGGAMAHYEPGTKVINLTRKNGVGTLAHEWGHFMDNVLAQVNGSNSGYLSEVYSGSSDSKSEKAMAAFKGSESWKQYKKEVREEASQLIRDGLMSPSKYKYWMSDRECFARAFEAHVQHKLESNGRENTYLSQAPKEGKLWPNTEMRKKMGPEFDKLMEGIKSSGDLKKAMDILRLTRLIDSFGSQNN